MASASQLPLPLPSYLAAVAEAAGVLLLLSHPHHGSAVIGAFAILALCETVFALQAVDGEQCTEAHRRLTTFLLTVIDWCLAAMPLAVAFFVQGRAAPESDSLARAALLVRLGAVYLVGTVGADLLVREEPFSSDRAHDCARINERGGLEVWAREGGRSDGLLPAWWAVPGPHGQACLLLAGVALLELPSLRHVAGLVALALGAQALPVLAGWSRGDGGWWPAGLCVSCALIADGLCTPGEKLRAVAAAHPASPAQAAHPASKARRLAGYTARLALLMAAALLGAWHWAETLRWLQLLQPSELVLFCCAAAAAACLCSHVLEDALLRVCCAYAATPWPQRAAYDAQSGGGPNRCLAPGTHLPPLNLISDHRKLLPSRREQGVPPAGWQPIAASAEGERWAELPPPPPPPQPQTQPQPPLTTTQTPPPPPPPTTTKQPRPQPVVAEVARAEPRPALPRAQPRPPRLRTPRRPSDTEAAPCPVPTPQVRVRVRVGVGVGVGVRVRVRVG